MDKLATVISSDNDRVIMRGVMKRGVGGNDIENRDIEREKKEVVYG
jgi:hypothetical protein